MYIVVVDGSLLGYVHLILRYFPCSCGMPRPSTGMGKTCSALWMSRHVGWLGRLWLFVSLPTVDKPFTRHNWGMDCRGALSYSTYLHELAEHNLLQCGMLHLYVALWHVNAYIARHCIESHLFVSFHLATSRHKPLWCV